MERCDRLENYEGRTGGCELKTTTRKPRPYNATPQQARHLLRERRLLVVDACKFQPVNFEKYSAVAYGQEFPYQPGDVVPLREPIRYSLEHDNYYYVADNNGCGTLAYIQMSGIAKQDIPARQIPESAIRLHPVVESVECRRVNSITDEEAQAAAFTGLHDDDWPLGFMLPRFEFAADWNRRYRRCGEQFGFDRSWAWFTTFVLKGE